MKTLKTALFERKEYITFLSVLASFMVVVLHTNSTFWGFGYERRWVTANIIESVMYPAVPIFFMITGATLINYGRRYSTKDFFRKRFIRTVIPFFVWSAIAGVFIMVRDGKAFTVFEFMNNILNCKFIDFYWFFPALFAVYFAVPFLAAIPEESRKKWYGYAIVVALVLNSLLPFVSKLAGFSYSGNFVFPALSGYLVYVLIGYWIDNYGISKRVRIVLYAVGFLGLISIILGTQFGSFATGKIWTVFKGYTNIPCVMYAVAIFTFFKYLRIEKVSHYLRKLMDFFAPLAYGIYLVQWFVLRFVGRISWVDKESIIYRTIGAVMIYILCAIVVKIGSKIPIVKRIFI